MNMHTNLLKEGFKITSAPDHPTKEDIDVTIYEREGTTVIIEEPEIQSGVKEMKVLGTRWFSSMKGHFGIVVANNGRENKAYLGISHGESEQTDIKSILQYGAKFPVEQALELIK